MRSISIDPDAASLTQLHKYALLPTDQLKPAHRNARKHSTKQIQAIVKSIEEVGTINPIIVDGDSRIVAGHGRWQAAKILGLQAVPTLMVDHLSEAQLRLYALADNRIAERATWDDDVLAIELAELRLDAPDLDLTIAGWESPKIEFLIVGQEQTSWSDLDQEVENSHADPVTRAGDTWDFAAGHTLLCGSSLEAEAVATAVNGTQVQLVAEDPPYNLKGREYSGKGRHRHGDFAMGAGEFDQQGFRDFLTTGHQAILPHLVDGALVFRFIDGKHVADVIEAGHQAGLQLKNVIVWDKGKGSMGSLYRHAYELIVLLKHGKSPHVNNVMLGVNGRDRSDVWRYPGMNRFGKGRDRALAVHATVKPVQMICDLLLDVTRPGDVVFDGFSGSGTTLIAAEKMGRIAKVVELDPRYCDVAIERFRRAFGSEPIERSTGVTFSELAVQRSSIRNAGVSHAK